ncbi:MAG: hypothetical protein IJF76_00365 [Clostridia bacterium]|nr:hypothetical protein [Clostridia bacterium]
MKKFCAIILIIIVLCSLCGCVNVSYERKFTKDATVVDRISISLDDELLLEYGYSVEYAKEVISEYMANTGFVDVTEENSVVVEYERVYETLEEFYSAVGSGAEVEEEKEFVDFFIDDSEGESGTPFRSFIINGNVEYVWENCFPNIDEARLDQISYEYSYSTPYKSIESNADFVHISEEGLYTHEWKFNPLQAKEGRLRIRQVLPNSTGWYSVIIILAVLIVAAGFMITDKMKEKEEKKDGRKKTK